MKLGIIACDILKPEIEFLTKGDDDFVVREYLEFALHEYPQDLKRKVEETVNSYEGKLDAIFLGYATCNSLEGILAKLKVPTVMLQGADCIDVILTPDEYAKEKKICTGTWFISPGWAEQGVPGLIKELHLDSVDGYDADYFLDILFDSYQRCLYIDDGIGNSDYYREKSEKVAKDLKLKLDCRKCNIDAIRDAIERTKQLAMQK